MKPFLFACALAVLVGAPEAFAEDSWNVVNEPPAPPQPEVKKWCEQNGTKVRWSNREIPGYEPCGQPATQVLCDASGKRFISSPGKTAPSNSYRDCSVGRRITVMRVDEPAVSFLPQPPQPEPVPSDQPVADYRDPSGIVEMMSEQEKEELRQKIAELERARNQGGPGQGFERAIIELLRSQRALSGGALDEILRANGLQELLDKIGAP